MAINVLLVTNMFPTNQSPYYGIFVKEQVDSIKRYHDDVNIDVFYIDGISSSWNYLKTIPSLINKSNSGNYDLVHIHYGLAGLFTLFAYSIKIPIVVTLHGGDIQIDQGKTIQVALTKRILKKATYAITLNDKMDDVVKQYCHNTVQCPCSVNTDVFKDVYVVHDCVEEKRIIFPSDRNRWVKNFPLFETVLSILERKYGIKTSFKEVKNMNREEVCHLFNESDLLIMTSRSEGSPQVVKEAMACNLPIVTTPVGDVHYLLSGVKNSIVCNSHDADEIASCAVSILANNQKKSTGREKIFALGLDDCSISNKIYSVYSNLKKQ